MTNIKLLDCTLRDGGYVVGTIFGDYTIKGITNKLVEAKVDIIELGYVKDCVKKEGSTTYSCMEEIVPSLPKIKPDNTKYAVMIEYNTFDLSKLAPAKEVGIDIIRICFFKNDVKKLAPFAISMMEKGYEVFLQPMDTLGYSDYELLELIDETNKIMPKALYIVDSYGAMYEDDLERIYSIFNHNLDEKIYIGVHSHNNLQLSFALVQKIVSLSLGKRNIIVDASCCGIGRGAGNANTELVVDYLTKKLNKNYNLTSILDILDTYILKIQQDHSWGYSVPYFISGMYNVHVNNISYLLNKHNLKAKDIEAIVACIDRKSEKRYDYEALENSIVNYFSKEVDDKDSMNFISNQLKGRKVLLVAPGSSALNEQDKIKDYINKYNPVVVCVNSIIPGITPDFLFYSNQLRYDYSKENFNDLFEKTPKILTSNIKIKSENSYIVNYNSIIKRGWKYFDNSMIMCIRLMLKLSITDIAIAGFDGYDTSSVKSINYVDSNLLTNLSLEDKEVLNKELSEMLYEIIKTNPYEKFDFITKSNIDVISMQLTNLH